jgi:beta-lactamase class A
MQESGDSSRKSRKGGFSWFGKSRRKGRSARSRPTSDSVHPVMPIRPYGAQGNSTAQGTHGAGQGLSNPIHNNGASNGQPSALGGNGRGRSRPERLRQGQKAADLPPAHSSDSDPSALIPFPRRATPPEPSRSRRGGGRPRPTTLLQGHTQLQPETELQPETPLQPGGPSRGRSGAPTSLEARRSRRRKSELGILARPKSRSMAIALYATRMLILSVGIGVLAGTVLSAWNPANNPFATDAQSVKQASVAPSKAMNGAGQLQLAQELTGLKTAIQTLSQQYKGLSAGTFVIDVDTGNYVDLTGSDRFSAASTIKLPVLVALFQDIDAGKIRLDEKLAIRKDLIGGGSGELQGYPVGTQFSVLDVATKMMTVSDNTATNLLIDKLGGMAALNQRFQSWGLAETSFKALLPDLPGANQTSPKELTSLMVRIGQGDLVSIKSRDRILDIMKRTINNSQLPQGLGEGATIAHKTGDIGTLIGDVGLVDVPNGKRYAIAVLVKCPFNDSRAYDLVQKISRLTYQQLSGNTSAAARSTPTGSASPNAEQRIPDTAPVSPDPEAQ